MIHLPSIRHLFALSGALTLLAPISQAADATDLTTATFTAHGETWMFNNSPYPWEYGRYEYSSFDWPKTSCSCPLGSASVSEAVSPSQIILGAACTYGDLSAYPMSRIEATFTITDPIAYSLQYTPMSPSETIIGVQLDSSVIVGSGYLTGTFTPGLHTLYVYSDLASSVSATLSLGAPEPSSLALLSLAAPLLLRRKRH